MPRPEARKVAAIVVLPPPFNGMTIATAILLEHLKERVNLVVHRMSRRDDQIGGFRWIARKQILSITGMARMTVWRARGIRAVYLVANSRGGLWVSEAQVRFARMLGMQVFLHHQVYSYLGRADPRMKRTCASMRASDVHIVLCDRMASDLRRVYGTDSHVLVLPNTITLLSAAEQFTSGDRGTGSPRVLGHLSNLSIEKGLGEVIEAFRTNAGTFPELTLRLAGPCSTADERRLIDAVVADFPDRVEWMGPLRGAEKWRFFQQIDVFLFPTRYANEAYPLVLAEAILSGCPVIARDRGCIASLVLGGGGEVIGDGQDFGATVRNALHGWRSEPDRWHKSLAAVAERGERLRLEVEVALRTALNYFADGMHER